MDVDLIAGAFLLVNFEAAKMSKTYNSRDSLMVTHLTTNPPVSCLNRAERTGSLVFMILWSYVEGEAVSCILVSFDTLVNSLLAKVCCGSANLELYMHGWVQLKLVPTSCGYLSPCWNQVFDVEVIRGAAIHINQAKGLGSVSS